MPLIIPDQELLEINQLLGEIDQELDREIKRGMR